jgi:transposase-like protein
MDIKQQAIHEYLHEGVGYRTLAKKYGVSRTTINKWVMVHQGIHNLPPTENQQKYYLSPVKNKNKNQSAASDEEILAMQEKNCFAGKATSMGEDACRCIGYYDQCGRKTA